MRTATCRFCGRERPSGTIAKHYRRSHWPEYQRWRAERRERDAGPGPKARPGAGEAAATPDAADPA